MKRITLLIVAIAAISQLSFGQSPEGFKYQAVVRDAGNLIITNQAVGIQMSIQQGSIGGAVVYSETFSPTTNAFGLVNLEIGSGTTSDDFSLIDWANGPYFIETAIDITGGTSYLVLGTSQLMSVPYALHAKTAESTLNDAVNDADADPLNEIQDVSLSGTDLTITGGSTIDLSVIDTDTDTQLNEAAVDAMVANNGYITNADDADADPTNEIQDISLSGTDLTIDDGSTIDLSVIDTDTDTQLNEAAVDAMVANNGYITNPDDADADPTNEIQDISLNGTDLTIDDGSTIDLSVIDTDTDTQLNEAAVDAMVANNGYITNADDADADPTNEIQDISLSGTDLTIDDGSTIDLSVIDTDTQLNETAVDAMVANNGYIFSPDDADSNPLNEIQAVSTSGNNLTLSGANTVDLTGVGLIDYSTSIAATGQFWTDGKPIYARTFVKSSGAGSPTWPIMSGVFYETVIDIKYTLVADAPVSPSITTYNSPYVYISSDHPGYGGQLVMTVTNGATVILTGTTATVYYTLP